MQRLYTKIVEEHFANNTQMLFLAGPRQVGKTTLAKEILSRHGGIYLNWDNLEDRITFLGTNKNIIDKLPPRALGQGKPFILFDEIHKYKDWKNRLKGFYDEVGKAYNILVTGSAKLDLYHKGGDSLMGRYFPYSVHPISINEILRPEQGKNLIEPPQKITEEAYKNLFEFGGFPDPYIKASQTFARQWKRTRYNQLLREDIRDLGSIQDVDQLELLVFLLKNQIGNQINYTNLANKVRVTDMTIRRWIGLLKATYYCYFLRPWSTNVPRSLLKDPKVYLWDWSDIDDPGARFENFIAAHLHKSVAYWNESGKGDFELFYLRDKDQREVDFLVTQNNKPWMLVEAKVSSENFSPSLLYFKEKLEPSYTFQVVHDMAYLHHSCFETHHPLVVPARTFLSQLV
jgi:predicted AAA+ superfamily ATPase